MRLGRRGGGVLGEDAGRCMRHGCRGPGKGRGVAGLGPGDGGRKKWLDSGSVLKVRLMGFF